LGLLLVVGCGKPAATPQQGHTRTEEVRPLHVVVTTGMIADAVKAVGGEYVRIDALMGPGVDPHQYKATPSDIRQLQIADVVIYNGLHLEGKMADVLEKLGKSRKSVAITRDLDMKTDIRPAPPGYEGAHDPHVWFDVSLWSKCVGTVAAVLADADRNHADVYAKRADDYRKQLAALHEEVLNKAKTIPQDKRVLITAHDAFYYFGRAYGFEVHGLQGVSTASEPGTGDVQTLAKLIGTRKLPAIFGETSVPDRNLQSVVDAAKKDYGVEVKFIAGQLFSDAMGDPKTPEGTYAGMIRHNIDTMVKALK
jgi:manganese/zinc/iron transport system substrate-binding protein